MKITKAEHSGVSISRSRMSRVSVFVARGSVSDLTGPVVNTNPSIILGGEGRVITQQMAPRAGASHLSLQTVLLCLQQDLVHQL